MCYDNEYRMNKSRREKIMKKRIVFATGNAGKKFLEKLKSQGLLED